MIRHRLLCLGYFDFGSVGLFNLGFLSLFAAYAQQSQNAAADVQSSQPTDVVAAATGLRTLGGVVISWLIGVIITAACIVGVAAVGELVDDRILAALGAANGAFLVLDAGGQEISSPRWAGRQCSTMTSGFALSSSLPVSWKPTKSRRRCSLSGVPGLAVFHTAVATTSAS